jgi:hypothetical protein
MQLIIDNAAVAQLQQTVRTDQYNVAVLTAKVQYDTNPFVKAVDSALLAAADSKLDSDFIALVMAEQKLMYDQTH